MTDPTPLKPLNMRRPEIDLIGAIKDIETWARTPDPTYGLAADLSIVGSSPGVRYFATDTLTEYLWDGTRWVNVGPFYWSTWTPTITQLNAVAVSVDYGDAFITPNWVTLQMKVTISAATGVAGNAIIVGGLPANALRTPGGGSAIPVGIGLISHGGNEYRGIAALNSASSFVLLPSATDGVGALGNLGLAAALAINDTILCQFSYQPT